MSRGSRATSTIIEVRMRYFVLLLAACTTVMANVPLAENSRLGSLSVAQALHLGIGQANSFNATGIAGCLCDERRRSRSTSKERDAETGLDYFGARYFSAAQGRFTSPDWSDHPEPVPYAQFDDPQTLKLYAYVRNNPLLRPDLDGHSDSMTRYHQSKYGGSPGFSFSKNEKKFLQGTARAVIGVGLMATVAGGDLPGGALGASLAANSAISAAAWITAGTVQMAGAATDTDVSKGTEGLSATGNLWGLAVTAISGGNIELGAEAATLTSAGTLARNPAGGAANPATAAKGVNTLTSTFNLLKSWINGATAPTPPPPAPPKPPPPPPCSGASGECK